ncbi:MAG: hypothetical protein K2X93_01700 [Candidatus Obscuribacterales bacterium]|nr:hypothetical protein [Candidatus Obscuribacterales bacterium]
MTSATKFTFPDRISLGGLYLAGKSFPHQRKWVGEAVGEVAPALAEDKLLGLQISGHISESMLAEFQPILKKLQSFDLSTVRFSDNVLKEITQLEDTVELRLDFVPFEDNHVAKLAPMKNLATVWFLHTSISNKSLRYLASLPSLQHLILKKTEITDGGLVHLRDAKQLSTLLLPSEITDNGLEELANLDNLIHLDLSNTRVTDQGLEFVSTMANLQTLCVNDTAVGDAGLTALSRLAKLRTLYISGTKVSDKGLTNLEPLKNLEYLEIRDNKVTDIALQRLRSAIPACNVFGP